MHDDYKDGLWWLLFTPMQIMERLSRSGLVIKDKANGWQTAPQGFVWWLADVLGQHVGDDRDFQSWLQ